VKVRVFHHKTLEQIFTQHGLDLIALKEDFKRYKESGVPPSLFGRDAKYNHPNTLPIVRQEKLSHIHLEEPDKPWPVRAVQFSKTSDVHLVYCRGFHDEDCFLLMALLSPNAHDQALNRTIMYNLGKMAEKFRIKY
jgi:mRNA interferase YafO